ncbi:MAG: hypothetical protein LR001_00140 [Clostridiales bacterium]|nr:hypothetical protein [Clostridiales bacterium]
MFHPKRITEIIRFCTIYDKNIEKIARYQQCFATKEIVKTIREVDKGVNADCEIIIQKIKKPINLLIQV